MNPMRFIATAATVAFVLALPVLLFTTSMRVLASDVRFVERGLREHGAVEATGITLSELDRAAEAILRYFEDDAETLRILVFADGEETALFSEEETLHLEDVKGIMRALYRANEAALGFVLLYVAATVLWSAERSGRDLAKQTLVAVGAGAAVALAVGAIALVGFDSAWDRLHELVFTNDLWRLDPQQDRLIQMFPEPFWQEATLIAGGATLVQAAALVAVAGTYLWFRRTPGATDGDAVPAEDAEGQEEQPQPAPPQAQPPGPASI